MKRVLATFILIFTYSVSFVSTSLLAETTSTLPALNGLSDQTSISGLSSGAFMSAQFHIAYSSDLVGAGIVAGGPWNCAQTNPLLSPLVNATTTCMNPCKGISPCFGYPDGNFLASIARDSAKAGSIDPIENIADDRLYIFSGQADDTVKKGVVDSLVTFYTALGVNTSNMYYNASVDAGHAFITADKADQSCELTQSPFINNCNIHQAEKILSQIYGPLNPPSTLLDGQMIKFDQSEFFSSSLSSMDEDAYVYIPKACNEAQCRVHVAVHGCGQGISTIGTEYVDGTGYNEIADTNHIIVLYPQVKKSFLNPLECWDFWGYTNSNLPPFDFYTKSSIQMTAIKSMIDRLISDKG